MSGPVETSRPTRPAKAKRRLWLAVPAVLAGLMVAGGITYGPGLAVQAQAGTDFGARISCSCHYVEGRPIDQCRADFEPGMSMVRLSVEDEDSAVIASVPMLASTRASYRDGWGCVLEEWNG